MVVIPSAISKNTLLLPETGAVSIVTRSTDVAALASERLGIEPDIGGTVIGMTLTLCALLFVPFVDGGERKPASFAEAFAWETGKWAFLLMALYWMVFLTGVAQNALAGPG